MNSKLKKWDKYFLEICNTVASNSKCLSRKIGAILVDEKSIVATGYNGPPRGVDECQYRYNIDPMVQCEMDRRGFENPDEDICPRYFFGFKSGKGLEYCIAGHAERNALINAARTGMKTKGLIMYMNCSIPCKDCLIEIINAGVERIVTISDDYYDEASIYLLKNSRLKQRVYSCEVN